MVLFSPYFTNFDGVYSHLWHTVWKIWKSSVKTPKIASTFRIFKMCATDENAPVQICKKVPNFKILVWRFVTSNQGAISRRNTRNHLFYPGFQQLHNTKILGWIYWLPSSFTTLTCFILFCSNSNTEALRLLDTMLRKYDRRSTPTNNIGKNDYQPIFFSKKILWLFVANLLNTERLR